MCRGLLIAVLAWPLFAFGGAYGWAALPFVLASALLALLCRPTPGRPGDARALDRWLIVSSAILVLQLVPLPGRVLAAVSPHAHPLLGALRLDYHAETLSGARPAAPVSIDPGATMWAASVALAAVLVFFVARRLFTGGGLRAVVRALAWMGLLVAAVALVQQATSRNLIYWVWTPLGEGAEPFGPFVNRNHFGTFAIMAIPTTFGYLIARLDANRAADGTIRSVQGLARVVDGRSVLLLTSGALMTLAAMACLSRSALAGLAVALATVWRLARQRLDPRRRRWLVAYAVVFGLAVLAWTNAEAVLRRLDQTLTSSSGRMEIWTDTIGMVRDFWLTGTGAGTYQIAMRVYQTADRTVYFNQAHNHYLQILAEGGVLLAVPVALVLAAFIGLARRRLAEERFAVYWIRLGAAAGLLAAGLQSVWETGLRMPANAVLAAVLAAIVVHAPRRVTAPAGD